MKINKIKLTNFRNWEENSFDFSDKVLIYGPNANGKTNILEAIYIASTTKSFRGRDAEVIKENKDFMKIEVVFEKDLEVDIKITFKNGIKKEKNFNIMGRKRGAIDFVGEFSAVIFSPEDINLISGEPADKRRYLSFTIGQKDKNYLYDLLNYKKILKHRNELLKKGDLGTIREEIDVWDKSISVYAQRIIKKRKELESFINDRINSYYNLLSGKDDLVSFEYIASSDEENILESLYQNREKDILEKTTTIGPHRDNWEILLNNVIAEGYASRGEQRTLILALKLCERDYFVWRDGINPVILLDDVFSELDEERRKYLIEAFSGSQLIITTTDLDHLDTSFHKDFQLINIGDKANLNMA